MKRLHEENYKVMVTIAVTDDNEMLRKNISERLKKNYQIVFEASSARSLLRFLKSNNSSHHPQVILMDIEMDEMDGIEATKKVKE